MRAQTINFKKVKSYTIYVLLAVFTLTTFSCSKDKDKEPDYSMLIIGKWKIFTDYYFQENGQNNRELVERSSGFSYIEFKENGTIKNGDTESSYSISGKQLTVNENLTTITKLDKSNLIFEGKQENYDYDGKTGTVYIVYTGTK